MSFIGALKWRNKYGSCRSYVLIMIFVPSLKIYAVYTKESADSLDIILFSPGINLTCSLADLNCFCVSILKKKKKKIPLYLFSKLQNQIEDLN